MPFRSCFIIVVYSYLQTLEDKNNKWFPHPLPGDTLITAKIPNFFVAEYINYGLLTLNRWFAIQIGSGFISFHISRVVIQISIALNNLKKAQY